MTHTHEEQGGMLRTFLPLFLSFCAALSSALPSPTVYTPETNTHAHTKHE